MHELDIISTCSSIPGRQQFLSVADLLNVSISEVGQRKTWLEAHCATFYTSRFSTLLKTAVDSMSVHNVSNINKLIAEKVN